MIINFTKRDKVQSDNMAQRIVLDQIELWKAKER